jgi:DNA-binding transcriptional regulator YiaG
MTASTMTPLASELEQMTPDELKAWRADHGDMSRAELARRLEIAPGTVRNYEQGVRKIPPFMRRALRDIERELEGERRTQEPQP